MRMFLTFHQATGIEFCIDGKGQVEGSDSTDNHLQPLSFHIIKLLRTAIRKSTLNPVLLTI